MKILNVGSHHRVKGGSDRYSLALESLLRRKGHRVIPFAASSPEDDAGEEAARFPPGVDADNPSPADVARFVFNPEARSSVADLLEKHRPDIAHLHAYSGQLSASILKPIRQRGVPIVQTLHDYKLGCPVRIFVSRGDLCEACEGEHFWRALPRRCNRGALARTALNVVEAYVSRWLGDASAPHHFVAPSRFLRNKMRDHDIVAPDRITTVPNFVYPGDFRPARGAGEHLVYVGRLREMKGVRTLVHASASLPEVPLLIVGTGPDREALERGVDQEGLSHVRFVGFKDGEELHDLIRRSIAVVVPSELYENCPMVVLEAMALGRPVIGSEIGGIPELVTHGEDGLLFDAGDTEGLRARLEWAVAHRTEAQRMGEAGRRKIEEKFGPDTHYDRLMEIYRAVVPGWTQ